MEQVITIYNGRAEIENRKKEGKNTLRWDKTSRHRFAANQARILIGCLAYNLLHMIRDTEFWFPWHTACAFYWYMERFYGLEAILGVFRLLDEPQRPLEIRWWSD
jgi:hypothetical protein